MQIQAVHERDAGKRILCNGQVYVVADGGALCHEGETEPAELDEAAANKLLQNVRAWEPFGTPRSGRAPRARPPGMGIQLIDTRGNVLEREQPPEATEPPAELEQSTVPPILPPPMPTEPVEPAPVAEPAEVKGCSPSPGDTGEGDPPVPAAGEEWADPKPTYSMQWLRACARAYEIKFGPRSSAETLCERITAAMYGSGESET